VPKPEHEFFPTSKVPWTPCAGDIPGLDERILASDDVAGVATRMLRFAPGTDTSPNGVQVHDFWEEVFIVEGSFTDLTLGETFGAGMFACRPPGMPHGPWVSMDGCLTFEARYRTTAES
jgi:ChrR Cupin-like domain